jgi:phage recombination protein Bet
MTTEIQTTKQSRDIEFVPFGAADSIKLNIAIVKNLVAVPTKSGAVCSDRDAIRFMMLCQAQRLNPFAGDAYLVGYDGKNGPEFSLITAHAAFLKRAETNPEFDGMKSGIIILEGDSKLTDIEGDFHLPKQNVVGGWATVYFKNRKHPITRRVRMERFNKGFAQWAVDPAGMICKCAEADALRSSFPTLLGGLYMRDEMDPESTGTIIEMVSAPRGKPNLIADTAQIASPSLISAVLKPVVIDKSEPALEQVDYKMKAPMAYTPSKPMPAAKPAPAKPAPVVKQPEPEPEPEPAPDTQPEPGPQPEESVPSEPSDEPSPNSNLQALLENVGVAVDDFLSWVSSTGRDKINQKLTKHEFDALACGSLDDVPSDFCANIAKDSAAMAKVVKLFGPR